MKCKKIKWLAGGPKDHSSKMAFKENMLQRIDIRLANRTCRGMDNLGNYIFSGNDITSNFPKKKLKTIIEV